LFVVARQFGASGKIDGEISCENADISGKVIGKLDVKNMLFLKASAYVEGDIKVGKLVVESGARFNGNCQMAGKEIRHEQKSTSLRKEAV
jgi:cytoskeletal protein CcmA (bactofilin family)